MDFVPVDPKLRRHPKIRRISALEKCSKKEAWASVVALWCWAFEFAKDGDLTALNGNPNELSEALDLRPAKAASFFASMIAVGLLDVVEDRVIIHDWRTDGCGRMIVAREQERRRSAERKRRERQRSDSRTDDAVDRDVEIASRVTDRCTSPVTGGRTSRGTYRGDRTGQDKTGQDKEQVCADSKDVARAENPDTHFSSPSSSGQASELQYRKPRKV